MAIYHAASNVINGLTNAQNLLSIENPSASTLNVLVTDIEISAIQSALSVLVLSYHIGRTTALPSSGTILTAQKRDSGSPSAMAVIRVGPTATAASGQIWSMAPQLLLGISLTGVSPFFRVKAFETRSVGDSIILAPGEGLLVSVDANLSTWSHTVVIGWQEETR